MKRRHKILLPILLALPMAMGASTITYGPINVSEVKGDPLIAGESQNLTFTIDHRGQARNIFDFVFQIEEDSNVVFQVRRSYFKVSDGFYYVDVTIPGSVLKEDKALRFTVLTERRYSDTNYVRYFLKTMTQTPKESGSFYTSGAEDRYFSFKSLYYPSMDTITNSSYFFYNVQQKRDSNTRRLHLEDIRFVAYGMKGYEAVNEQLGFLRIYTKINYWKIGEKPLIGKFIYLPLTYSLTDGVYSLQLLKTYSFDPLTGEMSSKKIGYPSTRDLILPYWATSNTPIRFEIVFSEFNAAGESYSFSKKAYYDGTELNNYTIQWEEC